LKLSRWFLAAALAVSAFAPATAAADWPTRPVRVIAPSTPGGAADTFARLVADHCTEMLGQRFYVENRPGAGGSSAWPRPQRPSPDGYTLVTASIGYNIIAPAINANAGFDPPRDVTYIAYLGGPPNVLVVNPMLGVRSLPELVARARSERRPRDRRQPARARAWNWAYSVTPPAPARSLTSSPAGRVN
jgi:tripartite-type tricarboxylate transporter receptor subunit TctC